MRFLAGLLLLPIPTAMSGDALRAQSPGLAHTSLLAKVLQTDDREQPPEAAGQCVFVCGERLVEVGQCRDGSCPIFDCRTGTAFCPASNER